MTMTMTVWEALDKSCPNRFSTDNIDACCIGSRCMAWRWYKKHDGGFPGRELPEEEWTGYCGLGGRP